MPKSRPLWRCPKCSRDFANRHQSHFCGRHKLESHFAGKDAAVLALYQEFVAQIKACGPVKIVPEKTRIAFQVRMSFAAIAIRRMRIVGHLVLACREERSCFQRIDTISPRNHVHHFVLRNAADLKGELSKWIPIAYLVGEQKHLRDHP